MHYIILFSYTSYTNVYSVYSNNLIYIYTPKKEGMKFLIFCTNELFRGSGTPEKYLNKQNFK